MSLASAQEKKNMQAAYDSYMKATYNFNDINAFNGNTFKSCPVILVAVIKVGDITVAVIWVGSEVWSFWSRSLRSRSFRSWSFLSVF